MLVVFFWSFFQSYAKNTLAAGDLKEWDNLALSPMKLFCKQIFYQALQVLECFFLHYFTENKIF